MRPGHLSFEFFPPKTEEGKKSLLAAQRVLAAFSPDFFSITCGAGGSSRSRTQETVQFLAQQGAKISPHVTGMGAGPKDIEALILNYLDAGIRKMVLLRGDPPLEDAPSRRPSCAFAFASDLVRFSRALIPEEVEIFVAAYPEVHPEAISSKEDLLHLKEKLEAGANAAITQYFFNPDAYVYFREACLHAGISAPIIPGVMPITDFAGLRRFSARCGAEIPRWLAMRLQDLQETPEAMEDFGADVVARLCEKLLASGAPGLHFYTLNRAAATERILLRLGIAPGGAA